MINRKICIKMYKAQIKTETSAEFKREKTTTTKGKLSQDCVIP